VKICPSCEAELKDSVIRCVRCGRTVREDVARGTDPGEPAVPDRPRARTLAASHPVWAIGPAEDSALAMAPEPVPAMTRPPAGTWTPAPGVSAMPDLGARRALPARRSWGPDAFLLLAGMLAVAAGGLAYLAISEPWVHLTVTRAAENADSPLVLTMSLRGRAAFVGTAAMAISGLLAVLGLVWFLYGFQRGWTMPGLANPAFGLLVTTAGLLATGLSAMVWFVWKDAMVLKAKSAGMTMQAMKRLVEQQPSPLVQIGRLSGLMTFGGMMLLGLLASCLGWYAHQRRE
jgi:hypothetical protein